MIDTHVHLNHEDFSADLPEVLERARAAGVTHMVNISFDLASSRETLELVRARPFIYGAVGVHPHDASSYDETTEHALAKFVAEPNIIAIGEIGLDYYRDLSPRDIQRRVFERQLALARACEAPVIIHCRDAFEDVVAVLREAQGRWRGIFHAFSGDRKAAETVIELGFHVGIGGVVTFRNSRLAEVVAGLPPEVLVLETDCPYLTPAPYRGKRNEPSYLTYVVARVAEATGRSVESVVQDTTQNFHDAMGLST